MSSFSFEHPWILLLIFLVIICALKCKAKESALIFPHLRLLKAADRKKGFLIEFLKYSTLFLLIVSMAGPVREDNTVSIKKSGYDIVLVMDTSGSMKERGFDKKDVAKDKMAVVKDIAKDFIQKRKNDNIALVAFGSFAYVASPLTYDKKSLSKILDFIDVGIAGQRTAMLDGIALGIELLKKGEAKSKIMVLLTDGIDNASKIPPGVIIRVAKKYHIKIYTVAIGDQKSIDENLLKKISKKSKGRYFFATDAKTLKKVYNEIDELEKSKIKSGKFIKKDELFIYPLFVAVLALLWFIYLYSKRGV